MTASEAPPPVDTMTLADAFAMVEVIPGDAIGLLNSLAEANADKHPGLTTAINAAIADIASGNTKDVPDESEVITEDSPPV